MSTRITMALAAALVAAASSVAATPAPAGDQDLVTELQDSGLQFGVDYTTNPLHIVGTAYASARPEHWHARAPRHAVVPDREDDFQLRGR